MKSATGAVQMQIKMKIMVGFHYFFDRPLVKSPVAE